MFKRILVATHGTEGARKAEFYAIELARALNAELHGLYVVHEGWSSLVGIEWLHNSQVRMDFFRYAESQFFQRAREVLEDFVLNAADINLTTSIQVGEPTEVIVAKAKELAVDLIVIGPGSRCRSEEYQARISIKKLMKTAPCPVLLAINASADVKEGGGVEETRKIARGT